MNDLRTAGALFVAISVLAIGFAACSSSDGNNGNECKADQQSCKYYYDCPSDQDCVEGCCERAFSCSGDSDCLPEGVCVEGRCVHLCAVDTNCPEEAHCIFGMCEPYPQDVYEVLSSPAPDDKQPGQKQPLRVGIGVEPLDFPVGVSMWGFGARLGPRTPYRNTLGGSDSMWDRPLVKAFAFDNGQRRIILIRAPMGCSTDFMASEVAWMVAQATGENYLNRMVFSAPHSHSHPARFWNIFYEGVNLGVLGTGDFSYEIFHRIASSISRAVLKALDDLKPARIGYAIDEHMDPEGRVHHYRRGEYPGVEMDDVLVVIRVDDDQGNPRAVFVNMALHGTHHEGTTITMDAPGGVELVAQRKLQESTGLPVEVAFLSRCSGDVSPAGDGTGLDDWRKIQEVGERAWPKIKQLFESLEGKTTGDVELEIANRRVPVDRESLGYGPEEFYDVFGDTPCERDRDCSGTLECVKGQCSNLYHFGAFQCVAGGDEDPSTKYEDGHLGCIFSAQTLSKGRPIPQFGKARLTVLKMGSLGLITVPGEPMSPFGRDLVDQAKAKGMEDATILGYSQDHHLYIMHADNWLQGGYEPSMGIWGWKEGDYYFEKSLELVDWLLERGTVSDDAGLKPTFFQFPCSSDSDCGDDPEGNPMICGDEGFCIVAPTATEGGPSVLRDIDSPVERISMAVFKWQGGHPGVDLPRMRLQRQDGDDWLDVTNAAGAVYDDSGFETILYYRGNYEDDHTWELRWEERYDFPAGTYRIHVEGRYFDGANAVPYELDSSPFQFVPCSRLIVTGLSMDGTNVSASVLYPPGPTTDDGHSPFEKLEAVGVLRHSGDVPETMPWPPPADASLAATVTITPPSGQPAQLGPVPVNESGSVEYTYVTSRDSQGNETTSSRTLPAAKFTVQHGLAGGPGTYTVEVTVTDAFGNTGSATAQIQLP